jgi:thioesterase domain-containing protein/aryl carrier-like protein
VVDTVVETATQAYAHADLPFDQLVAELNPKRDSSYAPLVQIVFDLQEESVNWWQLSGLNVGPVRIRERTAKFDLHLSICRGQHGWESRFAYNSALFEAGTVARAAAHFVQLARQVVQSPDLPLDQFNPPERTKGVPADTASQEQLAELPLTPAVRADAVEQDNALGGAARNAMLANLWKKILKVDSIGPDEDFFSLGGNSLLAIQLIAELQRQTGYSLPVASLFAHSTVQEFSRYLLQFDACRVWESLVAVKPEGTRKAFFCVHPVSGGVDFIYKLAAHLPAQQPVYGLQARGLNGMDAPRESLEEMAAHYVQLIVKQQPEGPYHLGGYSLGGIIAYEMAIQLRQMGKDVGVLAVFDSYPYKPSERHYLGMPLKYVLLGSWHFLRTTLCFPWANWQQLATKTPVALRYFFTVLRHHLNGKQKAAPPQGTCQPASLAPAEQLVTAGVKAYNTYSFKPYPGKLVFYRATGGAAGPTRYIKNFDFGWNKFALGGVAVHELASDHNALFKTPEHIAFIATTLYTHLTKQEELSVRAERVPVVDESYRH